MRKMLACFLALLMCCTGLTAFAESLTLPEVLPKSYFLEAAQQDYPDWQIRRASYYISGRYEGESARYIEISIYRITDSAIELLELSTLINPIREGDDVSWSVSALIPVEIVSGAADDLCAMTAEEICLSPACVRRMRASPSSCPARSSCSASRRTAPGRAFCALPSGTAAATRMLSPLDRSRT